LIYLRFWTVLPRFLTGARVDTLLWILIGWLAFNGWLALLFWRRAAARARADERWRKLRAWNEPPSANSA
jgi:hypothetical protein